jgi:disulfide bond formation protein DsbB
MVAHFVPCRLCWYQRIAMYPLVPMLGLAALRADDSVRRYALVLAAIGAPISAWHILVERFPNLESGACDPANPCSLIWVNTFGYLTIPTMALSAFCLIGGHWSGPAAVQTPGRGDGRSCRALSM